jgi:hypothetical protein
MAGGEPGSCGSREPESILVQERRNGSADAARNHYGTGFLSPVSAGGGITN